MILAWHFAPMHLYVRPGWPYVTTNMRACERALDALFYAQGPRVVRLELLGQVSRVRDLIVADRMRVLWSYDATNALLAFDARVLAGEPSRWPASALCDRVWGDAFDAAVRVSECIPERYRRAYDGRDRTLTHMLISRRPR